MTETPNTAEFLMALNGALTWEEAVEVASVDLLASWTCAFDEAIFGAPIMTGDEAREHAREFLQRARAEEVGE